MTDLSLFRGAGMSTCLPYLLRPTPALHQLAGEEGQTFRADLSFPVPIGLEYLLEYFCTQYLPGEGISTRPGSNNINCMRTLLTAPDSLPFSSLSLCPARP